MVGTFTICRDKTKMTDLVARRLDVTHPLMGSADGADTSLVPFDEFSSYLLYRDGRGEGERDGRDEP